MASVYTTKRGKNKKGKLGVRKDAANNAANKLTQAIKGDPLANALFADTSDNKVMTVGASQEHRKKLALERIQVKLREKEAEKLLLSGAAPPTQSQQPQCQYRQCTKKDANTEISDTSNTNTATATTSTESSPAPAPRKLLQCGGCRSISYCSAECQKADWPAHKLPCKATQALVKTVANNTASTSANESASPATAANSAKVEELLLKS